MNVNEMKHKRRRRTRETAIDLITFRGHRVCVNLFFLLLQHEDVNCELMFRLFQYFDELREFIQHAFDTKRGVKCSSTCDRGRKKSSTIFSSQLLFKYLHSKDEKKRKKFKKTK